MDSNKTETAELDSWDQQDDPGPGDSSQTSEIDDQFSHLNVNAKPFVPNVNAPAFVPTFGNFNSSAASNCTEIGDSGDKNNTNSASVAPSNNVEMRDEDSNVLTDPDPPPDQGEPMATQENGPNTSEEMEEEEEEVEVAKAAPPPKKIVEEDSDEDKEPIREHVNVIFIGHVDAGKSTIGGHLMYLTGQVDKRTLEKYEREAREKNRESWYLSWALDTNQEERDKGKTVEVGRANFETDKKHFTILDAPGHQSFVPNMIGGAAQADLAVLVISARKGEFETGFERRGQTREHAMLAKTAGVKHLVVLINKMDDPTVEWNEKRYRECEEKLVPFLKKVGFNPKKDIFFIPVSGITGANLKESAANTMCPWYTGPSFIDYIDALPSLKRQSEGPLIMPITDRYKDMGTIIMGKIESGMLQKGDSYFLMPNKAATEVLSILSDEEEKNSAGTGENVKLKVRGVEEEDVVPGFVLCSTVNSCHSCKIFDAQIVILEYKSIICAGYGAVLHIHYAVEEVQIKTLLALVDKKTGAKSKQRPRFIKQDQVAIARLQTTGVVCMETFKEFPQMGRFTLRDEGKTIAIGKVLKLIE
ncbi:eukaryotic peptide chain release factor GTP-binding subunit ERF3A-like [Amphiura filiformis]|uniref:eukaryotic peptide chain release factor GTP-binding subunit ERF3A-like n=1 Tax=Amphiura filiformis TaxID=82378 RepID=UPI003B228698